MTAIKSVIGHMQGAAGVFAAFVSALCLTRHLIPPTANYSGHDPDLCLDVVSGTARDNEPRPILGNAFGFGGICSSVLFAPANGCMAEKKS